MDALITPEQLDALLSVSRGTCRRQALRGDLPAIVLPSGELRFDPHEVRAALSRDTIRGMGLWLRTVEETAQIIGHSRAGLMALAREERVPYFYRGDAARRVIYFDPEAVARGMYLRMMAEREGAVDSWRVSGDATRGATIQATKGNDDVERIDSAAGAD